MQDRESYIDFINAFTTVSPTISDEQHKRLLNRAVQYHGLSIDEAVEILNAAGLRIGETENFFEILGFSIEDFQNRDKSEIKELVEASHNKLYRTSLNAGGRPRPDGKTEEQWRILLNQARDTLIDPQKREAHINMLGDAVLPVTEPVPDEELSTSNPIDSEPTDLPSEDEVADPEPTVSQTIEKISDEQFPIPASTSHLQSEQDGMVLIPASTFDMGSNDTEANSDEKPVHTVYVDSFYMDKHPVTNAEFKAFIDVNPHWRKPNKWFERYNNQTATIDDSHHDGDYLRHWKVNIYQYGDADHPVTWVSWYAAMAYAQWVGKRLPTEAEWEKAARGGLTAQKYPWGQSSDISRANYNLKANKTTAVNTYPPNEFGLYDMVGNVREWCLDKWDKGFYQISPNINPITDGTINEVMEQFGSIRTSRVLRGGSWVSIPKNARIAYRSGSLPYYTCMNIGFRCVRSAE